MLPKVRILHLGRLHKDSGQGAKIVRVCIDGAPHHRDAPLSFELRRRKAADAVIVL
jgi:hypothetical protein